MKNTILIVAGLTAQHVTAGGWNDATPFSCPGNTNNHCSSSQQGGYNWSGLSNGKFTSFGSNQFSGFSCASSFGKRDLLTKRGFQSKCITANLDDNPSMSGGSFSINQIQISSSQDADIECHYGMPDGSTCTETHSCSSGGSIFQNTQCGGAKSVTFKPGKNAPPGCSIGVHSVGFHCSSASTPPGASSTTVTAQSVPPSSPPTYSTTSAAPPPPPSSPPTYSTSSTAPPPPPSSPPAYHTSSTAPSPPPPSTTSTSSSSAPSPPCYGSQCSSAPSLPVTSSTPPSYSGPCYGPHCGGSPTSVAPQSSSPPSKPPPKPHQPQCPDVLPRCLKTWMFVTKCKDNSDSNCFCGNEKLIKQVMSCLSAWSPSPQDTQAAASFLMGLCADHVPQNPAIITACPPGVTAGPTPPAGGTVSAQGTPPCTTITYSSTVTIPATYSTGVSAGFTCSGSSITTHLVTTVTVPRVSFTTSTVTVAGQTTCSVGLGGWGPSSAAASTTPAPPPPPTTSPPPATTGVVCSEFTDGQPQCYTTGVSSSPVVAASTFGTSWGTGQGWGASASASHSPIVPATGAGTRLGSGFASLAVVALAGLALL